MEKLHNKPISLREETFALAFCLCGCYCSCPTVSCNCPIAPTQQLGLNAQEENDTPVRRSAWTGVKVDTYDLDTVS